MTASALFSPLTIGPYTITNRIVMAPLARARSDEDRAPTPIVATYYAQRASAGLIVSEATHVSPYSISRHGTSAQHSEAQSAAWSRVAAAVHEVSGLIFQQLYHVGRKSLASAIPGGAQPVAPSAIAANGELAAANGPQPFSTPRALERAEIAGIVTDFRRAAGYALKARFDGIEIHAANGFLIDQFLRDGSNQRRDDYGGSVENRARFLLEVFDAVSEVYGPSRVGVRLSPHFQSDGSSDSNPAALFGFVASSLNARGAAYIHLIEGTTAGGEHAPGAGDGFLAPLFRRTFGGPLILAGDYDRKSAEETLRSGRADAIAFGRLFIANPDLPARFRLDAPLNEPDPGAYYGGNEKGYTDYPTLNATHIVASRF
jgi:N-ethylmaleimide reductase